MIVQKRAFLSLIVFFIFCNTKANHPSEAIAAKKQYELFNKMADEEWVKYRRTGL